MPLKTPTATVRSKAILNATSNTTNAITTSINAATRAISNTIKSLKPKEASIPQTTNPVFNFNGGKNKTGKTQIKIKRHRKTYKKKH